VVHQYVDVRRGSDLNLVVGPVAAKHFALVVLVVNVRSNVENVEPSLGHDPNIDATVVVAIDQHDMAVEADEVSIETHERRTILGLNDPK
jgi:hypothetical protein